MIKLPARVPQGQSGFTPAAYQNIQVSQGAFDSGGSALASMGKAMTSLGGSLDDIGQSMERDQVRQAVTEYDRTMRTTVMGSAPSETTDGAEPVKGFLSMQGPEAVTAYAEKNQALLDAQNRLRDSLPNGRARDLFDRSIAGYAQHAQQMMDQHYQSQIPIAQARTAEDASIEAKNMVVGYANISPDLAKAARAYGAEEAARAAALNPAAAMTFDEARRAWEGNLHRDIVGMRLETQGVDAASAYLAANVHEMSPEDLEYLKPKLALEQDKQVSMQALEPLTSSFQGWERRMGQLSPSAPSGMSATTPVGQGAVVPQSSPAQPLHNPYNQSQYYGLPGLASMEARYATLANTRGLTDQQRAIGLSELRQRYSQTIEQGRQRHRDLLQQGFDWLGQGKTVETLPREVTGSLSPRSLESLRRQQEINQGVRPQQTDFPTSLYLGMMPPAAFGKRVLAEDMPYLSPIGRLMTDGVQALLKSSKPTEVHAGEAYLGVMAKVNYAAIAGGADMQDGRVLDSLYFKSIKNVDSLIRKYGVLTDAQLWDAVSPVILDHLESKVRNGHALLPDRNGIALDKVSRLTGIPPDMVMPVWNDLKANPASKPGYQEMAQRYHEDAAGIMARAFHIPHDSLAPLVADVRADGRPVSLLTVLPLWSSRADASPVNWL